MERPRHVDALIDALGAYRDCVNVNDENALRGHSMLLTHLAADWWAAGVKASTASFEDALLFETYGLRSEQKKPVYKLYREQFANEQNATTWTDIFICKARALVTQLPSPYLPESTQLDMIFVLLHHRDRNKVLRTPYIWRAT